MGTLLRLAVALGLLVGPAPAALAQPVPAEPSEEESPEPTLDDRLSPAQKEVLRLLRTNRQLYGDDAALMQGLLLVTSVHSNSEEALVPLTSECEIEGFRDFEGKSWVSYRVESGIVFNDEVDSRGRLERVWHDVVERALLRYPSFEVAADGIVLRIAYHHRPYGSTVELYRTLDDDPGVREEAEFFLLREDLDAFLTRELTDQSFLDRSRLRVDEQTVALELRDPLPAWPPEPPPEADE